MGRKAHEADAGVTPARIEEFHALVRDALDAHPGDPAPAVARLLAATRQRPALRRILADPDTFVRLAGGLTATDRSTRAGRAIPDAGAPS